MFLTDLTLLSGIDGHSAVSLALNELLSVADLTSST